MINMQVIPLLLIGLLAIPAVTANSALSATGIDSATIIKTATADLPAPAQTNVQTRPYNSGDDALSEKKTADKTSVAVAEQKIAPTINKQSTGQAQQRVPGGRKSQPDKEKKTQSPYTYQPSEQISDDLPVAFPIDI